MTRQAFRSRRGGAVLVLALAFLSVFATLAVVLMASTDLALQQSSSLRLIADAQLGAESGLAYCGYLLTAAEITDSSTGQAILDSLATALGDRLNGSATLGGQSIGYDGTTIVVPATTLDGGRSFEARLVVASGKVLRLSVVGRVPSAVAPGGSVQRSLAMEVELSDGGAFGSGMYAKGPISIGSNFDYTGASDPSEASMACAAAGVAISVGSGHIEGDVTYDPNSSVSIGATVDGQVRTGSIPPPPQIDGSIYESLATNTVDSGTDFSSGTFTNIRVKARTDPNFGNNVTIQGVMYIEAPNVVTFTNNATVIGVIVSQDPGPSASPALHRVYFKNNMTVQGLDELPELPEFATLRGMAGSAFLLPGFTLEFKNNFSSVSGTMAAQEIITKNNLSGTVYGSIIALGSGGLLFNNNATLTIDRSRYTGLAPGLVCGPPRLTLRPSSYAEP